MDIKTWLLEAAKAAGRFLIVTGLPFLLDALLDLIATLTSGVVTLSVSPTEKVMISLALAFADKAIHEWKKNLKKEGNWKGLLGF